MSTDSVLFEGFDVRSVAIDSGNIRIRIGGRGEPLLLLYGNPQTHMVWHAVAPLLAEQYTVVCADLPGYRQSFKAPVTSDHSPYGKRTMALEMVQLMAMLGFPEFNLARHDRKIEELYQRLEGAENSIR